MKPHPVLYPLSILYGFGVGLRNLFFDIGIIKSVDAGVPVVSIGNITAGGSGKTPTTISVAKFFLERGKRTAVISRGYGRKSKGAIVVSDGIHLLTDARHGGDETVFIAQQLPGAVVIADEQRVRAAQKAVQDFNVEIIIMDDGFQHRYLHRKLDIVLLNGSLSPLETMLLPAGFRREPLRSLKRADAVIVTKVQNESEAGKIFENNILSHLKNKFSSSYQPVGIRNIFGSVRQSLAMVNGHSVIAVSGIANSKSFEDEILRAGGRLNEHQSFHDHHEYRAHDVSQIVDSFRKHNADYILTTEKDAVKLSEFKKELSTVPIFALCMEISIHQNEKWKKLLTDVIQ